MTDDLDALELAAQATRAARRAVRTTPVVQAKRANGRAQKARGYRAEKKIERLLAAFGFKRVPMSGALGGDLSGDLARRPRVVAEGWRDPRTGVHSHLVHVAVERIEVKHRDRGWPVLRRDLAQGNAHALVLDEGERNEPLFVLTASTMTALLREAGYEA